ncbi:MAG TPA: RNA polymerase sigma factor [Vicinamibacterales bacterium]|jgi:RNA polymerase sigma-70 factor (ECF subfamily)
MTGGATVAVTDSGDIPSDRLGVLFDAHHQRLYRLARRLSQNAEDARDLVQDTFLRAARAPSSVPRQAPDDEAWLVRVLVNLCRDRWRQTATRRRLHQTVDAVGRAQSTNPESAAVARSVIWHALDALDPRRRAVLVMHELEGASAAAIAKTLGITAVTVRWHLSRGRRQLAAVIRGEGDTR